MMTNKPQTEKDLDIFIPEGIEIRIVDRKTKEVKVFRIYEFVIETRTKFLRVVAEVIQDMKTSGVDLSGANTGAVAIAFVKIAGEKIEKIYDTVLEDVNIEWIRKNISIKKEIEIIKAIMDVNDFPFLLKEIQGIYKNGTTEIK